jgi:FkbM family methyltransferase
MAKTGRTLGDVLQETLRECAAATHHGRAKLAGLVRDSRSERSYSQFGEDAIIYRYFDEQRRRAGGPNGDPLASGVYVDVGAYMPRKWSNTYLFYRLGWSGINVDPAPGSMSAFRRWRRRDTNLELAIAAEEGQVALHYFGYGSPLNTLVPSDAPTAYWPPNAAAETRTVRATPLRDVLDSYLPRHAPFRFLTIDVEGAEMAVLRSNDWTRFRPELVAVEHHCNRLSDALSSELVSYLESRGYQVYAWANPTFIFRGMP